MSGPPTPYSARRMNKADKRQRQRENRAERRAREEQEARRRRMIRFGTRAAVVVAVVLGAGVALNLLGGNGDDEPTDTTLATTTTAPVTTTLPPDTTEAPDPDALSGEYQQYRELPVACGGTAPPPVAPVQYEAPEDQSLDPAVTITATVTTSCGDLVMELDPALAPETVNSFVFLARQDYFDGIVSHRIVPGFVVQTGDPTATGTGGPGYTIPDEFPDDDFVYDRGVVAMAKTPAPNTTGSQWFIAFTDTGLDATFNPVGRLVDGFEVLELIEQISVDGQQPLEALYIEDVAVTVG